MARDAAGAAGSSTWAFAQSSGIETWPAELVRDPSLAARIRGLRVDLVLNVHSLYVVHPALLAAAPLGWYNLHPGPLPSYGGLNAVSWAIYRGESSHAVTLHRMTAAIDKGDIAYAEAFPIDDEDTALTLSARCVRLGVGLVVRLVDQAAVDPTAIPAIRQDPDRFRYFDANPPRETMFSWDLPAKDVSRVIRAFEYYPLRSPWGHPQASLAGQVLGIVGVRLTGQPADQPPGSMKLASGGSIRVACTDEWVEIRRVCIEGHIVDAASLEGLPRTHNEEVER